MKMKKYKNAARDVLTPKVGYGLADELKRRKAECLVLVSDDSDFVGNAKKEAVSVVGKWRHRDILKRLEWTYNPEVERKLYGYEDAMFDDESEDQDFECTDYMHKEYDSGAWWELDTESDADPSNS
ncbi:Ribonuclease H-like protein [Hibiscus syriacus]|uniref:Ribonuclease H-like protein n=1 Tax=Hibiscus syriacus TaxID=106335 RepID=A0A6A3CY45_HIBSY|nr:Ribonuclease H-like protein [Hibiscus syriacus]